jgi:D-alanyl-D-alanine carboxypeptidase/D-alanyl-D-alanine-endopeptidase (penicillin-binding protein 4)
MRRHHVLPAALGFIAASATAAAFVIGGDPAPQVPRAIGVTTTTTAATETIVGGAATSTTVPTPVAPVDVLLTSLDAVWAQTNRPSTSCLMVMDRDEVVFERNPDVPVTPASTMKLLTATAVLHELDPTEHLRTRVVAPVAPANGVVDGDLYLVGGGDPVLGTVDWAADFTRQPRLFTSIETLADRVVAAGVRDVRGRVIGDETRYDSERYVPSWPQRYRDDNEVGRMSALSVNDGFAVWDGPDSQDIPWDDPPRDAAAVLTALLRARGVTVAGEPAAGAAPADAPEVAAIESPTIGQLVSAMLQDSDNGTAELLVKELGLRVDGTGTSAAGTAAVVASLTAQGLPMPGVVVHDGSGLDRGDHVTCRLLASILRRADGRGPIGTGLPIAAQTGTLYKRFLATPVAGHLRAKTGSISGVASLAGYADGRRGTLTFAQVLNGIGSPADAVRVQDALGAALVGA